MSNFAVTVERIKAVWKHENADLLEMASLQGKEYDFIVGKGQFIAEDVVVYFPVDSVLPEWICNALALTGKLAGKDKNRVKTVRLRGNISQGVVCEPTQLMPALTGLLVLEVGADVTELLGVTKYDPPPVASNWGMLKPMPPMVSVYDVESAQNYADLAEQFMDEPCYVSEKLEGSHWSATLYVDGDLAVCQRNYRVIPVDGGEHDWFRALRLQGLDEILRKMFADLQNEMALESLTLRGELIGPSIQGNIYGLKEREVRVFEIEINGKAVEAARFLALTEQYAVPTVPVLAVNTTLRDWLQGKSLKEVSDGQSAMASRLREGVVIKPMVERRDDRIGRVFLKQRSPEYLAKSDF
jgi:RNA ligase (TIGR02306 family)